jgi:colanic acid/amylovoran biosynthesis glycosyltransferase
MRSTLQATASIAPGTPALAFYSRTYLYRYEQFFYQQMRGIRRAPVHVIAQWAANLDEFPWPSLYVAEQSQSLPGRWANAAVRRLHGMTEIRYELPGYVQKRIARALTDSQAGLVYTLFGWNACQLVDVLEEVRPRLPLVFQVGGSDVTAALALGDEYVCKLRKACDRAAAVLASSKFLKSKLVSLGVPAEKIQPHYLGSEMPAESQQRRTGARDVFTIIAVSRLSPEKGVQRTIQAFSRVARLMPNAVLRIIGDGAERADCARLIDSLSLGDRVVLHGSLASREVYSKLAEADLFLQHSVPLPNGTEESFGVSIVEACAHALPVVVTRCGGIPEVVGPENGILVEPGDVDGMAEGILRLYKDPQLRESLGSYGRDVAMNKFNAAVQSAQLERTLLASCGMYASTGDSVAGSAA